MLRNHNISYHFLWSFLRSQCGWENHLVTLNFPDFKDPAVQLDQIKLVFLVKNSTTEKQKKMFQLFNNSKTRRSFLSACFIQQPMPKLCILNFRAKRFYMKKNTDKEAWLNKLVLIGQKIVKIRIPSFKIGYWIRRARYKIIQKASKEIFFPSYDGTMERQIHNRWILPITVKSRVLTRLV